MDNRGKRQTASIFGGMGFYIALLICVIAAGVVGYYALADEEPQNVPATIAQLPEEKEQISPVTVPEAIRPVIQETPIIVDEPEETEEEPVVQIITPPVAETAAVVSPLSGETVSVFSIDQLAYDATLGDWRTHDGIDILAAAGTDVVAASAGTVLSVVEDGRLGTMITIDHHNGYVTTYASLNPETVVLAGDEVATGTVIGAVGNTSLSESALGAHLHFSVTRDGTPIDPASYLGE